MKTLTISLGSAVSGGGGSGGYSGRGPRIGYDNVATGATITADSTADGTDPAQLFDWKAYTAWQPASGGIHYVTVTPTTSRTVDYFACAQHTLGLNSGSITLQYSTNGGGSWLDATAEIFPGLNETIWRSFAPISASLWRVRTNSTVASTVSVVAFGQAYQPYYGALEGFAPPQLAREAMQYSTESEAGLFLGRSILRRNLKTSVTFNNMHPSDMYSEWLPFVKHAEKKPFFFAWLLEDYPTDIALMESDGQIPSPTFMRHGAMSVSLPMRGLLIE